MPLLRGNISTQRLLPSKRERMSKVRQIESLRRSLSWQAATASKSQYKRQPSKPRQDNKPIHPLQQAENDSDSSENYLYSVNTPKKSPTVRVTVNKHCFDATIDTGATLNVIDRATYEKMDGVELKRQMLKHFHITRKRLLNF